MGGMWNVLLGVSGSVAAYKAAALVRALRGEDCAVRVALTPAAKRLVGVATFRALSGQAVLVDEWETPVCDDGMDHIAAAREADVLVVAPACADFVAKAAAGVADSLPLAAFLVADCPKFVAPAMNRQMWDAPPTRRNVRRLVEDGVRVLGPAAGAQACGEVGYGRMLDVDDVVAAVSGFLREGRGCGGGRGRGREGAEGEVSCGTSAAALFAGRRVVVSVGATEEPLDAMRVVSNRSSGRMGFCVAEALAQVGADVRMVVGRVAVDAPAGLAARRAVSGEEMRRAVFEETVDADWFFSVAAVADFRAAEGGAGAGKAAREEGGWAVTLVPTADVLAAVAEARPRLRCVGFAAQVGETAAQVAAARVKLRRKGVRYVALNDAGDAGRDCGALTLVWEEGEAALGWMAKREGARALLAVIGEREGGGGC